VHSGAACVTFSEENDVYSSVRTAFAPFTKTFEGRVPWMYLDAKALVTVAVGNVVDPVDAAISLPFVRKTDQRAATRDEIRAEWQLLKDKSELAQKGYRACEAITSLRLTEATMDDLVHQKLDADESVLKTAFPDWDSWPADAQLGVLSMAWALGAGFPVHWPKFASAAKAQDWFAAAAGCKIREVGHRGVKLRNVAHVVLFNNAAAVKGKALDLSTLHYPADTDDEGATTAVATGSSEKL
jgi:GH24 family phage-related lysozyme (muramidase)